MRKNIKSNFYILVNEFQFLFLYTFNAQYIGTWVVYEILNIIVHGNIILHESQLYECNNANYDLFKTTYFISLLILA